MYGVINRLPISSYEGVMIHACSDDEVHHVI